MSANRFFRWLVGLTAATWCAGVRLTAADWPVVGGDPGGQRFSPLTQIDRANVSQLAVAWTFHTGGLDPAVRNSAIQCTPIVVDGTVYLTSPDTQVIALEAASGRELWRFNPQRTRDRHLYNRGVAYWKADGPGAARRILAATPDGFLYSLDAATGKLDPAFGREGVLDLREGIADRDLTKLTYGLTSAPVIFEDRVILGVSLNEGYVGGPGHVRALDVRTGREMWRFHTIPQPGEFGHDTWAGESWKNRGGVNAWGGATVDGARGLVFVGTGSPGFDFHGGDRKGDNLFANCVIALDGRTGRRVWHYQIVHHDIWDYDLPAPPNLLTVMRDGAPVDAVAQITKQGFVFLFERTTGRPLFAIEERPVPQSMLRGEVTARTQPFPVAPPAFSQQGFGANDLTTISPAARAVVAAKLGDSRAFSLYSPHEAGGSMSSPGTIGGGNWSGASYDPRSALLFVNANNFPRLVKMQETGNPAEPWADRGDVRLLDGERYPGGKPPWGTLTAIDLNRGTIRWQVPLGEFAALTARGVPVTGTPNLGGTIVTAGGLVFVGGTMDEKIRAFHSETGALLWEHKLPFGGYATPCTYSVDGRQYVVIAAGGGGKLGTASGDTYVAFALPAR
ncbi:MAG: pyrroloquinoline quinone-dependent dehydrogenase [Opitutaceae bacterium]